jgi:hypothetical protein
MEKKKEFTIDDLAKEFFSWFVVWVICMTIAILYFYNF